MPVPAAPRLLARLAIPVALVLVVVTGACADDGRPTAASTTTSAAPAPAGEEAAADPQPSPRQATEALLSAEKSGDHAASYRLLTGGAREALSSGAWARRRNEVPAVTGFSVESAEGDTVVAVVEHEPGLDPFIGLSPARERQTWRARKEGGGWLLEPEPEVKALYPPPADAPAAALAWAEAAQACDAAALRSAQAVEVLFGTSDAPAGLCKAAGSLAVGDAGALDAGPSSQELVAQYGAEALEWARTVAITGGPRPFHVVLAPIGSVWSVVGVFEP
ncbi:MAG: hypothetical protein ACR2MO_15845 [Acidimicrobiales bacterium]